MADVQLFNEKLSKVLIMVINSLYECIQEAYCVPSTS